MSTDIRFYDKNTIKSMNWPETEDGSYAKRFLLPFFEQPAETLIPNVRTKLHALKLDEHVLPVTENDGEYGNSYVCSPYTHYISYARQELYLLKSRAARLLLPALLGGLGLLLKAGRFNRTVHVNNWLLSTNLYPNLSDRHIDEAVALLLDTFPRHTLVFRSLNRTTNGALMDALQLRGFRLVPSRQIYFLRPSEEAGTNAKARWLLKRDYGLLEAHRYEVLGPEQLSEKDVPRLSALYKSLYLDKYSYHNPQFGDRFFALALKEKLLQFHALRSRNTGSIDAVLGYFCRNGVMTTPVFGYDTSLPQELGLYRMLSAVLLDIARRSGHLLHESSGAAQFKRNRGAVSDMEYSAVYGAHLPAYRQAGWAFLQNVLNKIGVPLMRKYKL